MKYLIGIDEAGRGPLAGTVAVGAVVVRQDFDWSLTRGVRDSKKLTTRAREEWFSTIRALRRDGVLDFSVSFTSASLIDKRGIVPAIAIALRRCLQKLNVAPRDCQVLLDGNLYAPKEYVFQKTIIRGDDLEPIISLASVVAKVRRDRLMTRFAKRFPSYGFERHKGYGTLSHRDIIKRIGFCDLHRTTFCTRLLQKDQAPSTN